MNRCKAGFPRAWLAMVGDPEVRRFLPAGPVPTMELARRIMGEREAMERELGHAMWAVEDKTTGAFVGQYFTDRMLDHPAPPTDDRYGLAAAAMPTTARADSATCRRRRAIAGSAPSARRRRVVSR